MSVLERIAFYQNRRDEVPNQELAVELAEFEDIAGIQEIVDNLTNKNKSVSSDCIKVLYELGYIKPELIKDYVDDFIILLSNKNNRMVWGAMIGLWTIAPFKAKEIFENIETVFNTINKGTVITVVSGIKVLGLVASANISYNKKILPILFKHLKECNPREVPKYAEDILPGIGSDTSLGIGPDNIGFGKVKEFIKILESRRPEMTPSQISRLKKVMKRIPYEQKGRGTDPKARP